MRISLNPPEPYLPLIQKRARYKAYYGGRGGGKSHQFAEALLAKARASALRILCAREVQKSIKESVKQLLDDKIAALGMAADFDSIRDEIRCRRNASRFMFSGLQDHTVDSIKSFEGVDILWIEEAQTVSARSLELVKNTIRKQGSEIWLSWNPRHPTDPADKMFRGEDVDPSWIVRRVNYDENPYFSEEMEAERQYDRRASPDRYGHIWLGEYEPVALGAIWNRQMLHEHRREEAPVLGRILVAVDPAVSAESGSDEHGIIVGGSGAEDKRGYVIDDMSTKGPPRHWAERAVAAFDRYDADAIVIETNQGGDMVRHTLETVRPSLPIIEVRATRGKHVRAEPIAALYSLGRVSHVGTFPELEDQMCRMTAAGYEGTGSPDRCDAMVWLMTELFPEMTRKTETVRRAARPPAGRSRSAGWMSM